MLAIYPSGRGTRGGAVGGLAGTVGGIATGAVGVTGQGSQLIPHGLDQARRGSRWVPSCAGHRFFSPIASDNPGRRGDTDDKATVPLAGRGPPSRFVL